MIELLLALFAILFLLLSLKNIKVAIFLLFLFLPSYVIRFSFFTLPSTVLEIMVLSIIFSSLYLYKFNIKYIINNLKFLINKKYNTLLLGLSLMLLGSGINVFYGVNFLESLGIWKAFYVEPILLFFSLIIIYKKNIDIDKSIIYGLFISAFLTSILAIYQHYTGWFVPHDFWANRNTYRVTGWWGFPNGVGIYLAPISILAFGFWIKHKKNLLYLFLSIIGLISIIFAKSTGALVAVLGALGLYLLYNKKTRIISIITGLILFSLLVITPNQSTIKQELLLQDYSGQLRIQMWGETVEYLFQHPIVGTGLRSYQKRIYPYRADKWIEVFHHPHNMFLTAWVETGIIGLFGLLFVILFIFKYSYKNLYFDNLIISTSLFTFLIMGLVDSPYIKNDTAVLFWGLIFLLVINNNINYKEIKN